MTRIRKTIIQQALRRQKNYLKRANAFRQKFNLELIDGSGNHIIHYGDKDYQFVNIIFDKDANIENLRWGKLCPIVWDIVQLERLRNET